MHGRFDQFAKLMARAGFTPAGAVRTDEEVSPDARRVDIWFTPRGPEAERELARLGLLGRIGITACTLEPFHCTPSGIEVMDCVCKQHLFRGQLRQREPSTPLPVQWIVSSGRPETALTGLRFESLAGWGPGLYDAPPLTHTRLVVVAELPETRDTLLVRLMGAGRVLAQAIAELRELPDDAPERTLALPILLRLRLEVPAEPTQRTEDDEEFLMSTQDIVETFIQHHRSEALREGRDEGLREGRDEGLCEGLREALLDLYAERFGAPPADVVAVVARTRDREILRSWHKRLVTASAEEVLAAIRGQAAH